MFATGFWFAVGPVVWMFGMVALVIVPLLVSERARERRGA